MVIFDVAGYSIRPLRFRIYWMMMMDVYTARYFKVVKRVDNFGTLFNALSRELSKLIRSREIV